MTQGRVVIVVAAAFVAGLVSATFMTSVRAQGKVSELSASISDRGARARKP